MSKGKRRYLLAVAMGLVCEHCASAPGKPRWRTFVMHVLCGPCLVKAQDALTRGDEI